MYNREENYRRNFKIMKKFFFLYWNIINIIISKLKYDESLRRTSQLLTFLIISVKYIKLISEQY